MEHGESWTGKKVGTGRRGAGQAGKNEVRLGKGVWALEAGGGGGGAQSLVTGDTRCAGGVPEPAPYVDARHSTAPCSACVQRREGRHEYHSTSMASRLIISILDGHLARVGRFGPCCREQGPTRGQERGEVGSGVGDVGTREGGTYPDNPDTTNFDWGIDCPDCLHCLH